MRSTRKQSRMICQNCHRRKIKCDMHITGSPCMKCSENREVCEARTRKSYTYVAKFGLPRHRIVETNLILWTKKEEKPCWTECRRAADCSKRKQKSQYKYSGPIRVWYGKWGWKRRGRCQRSQNQ
jgi:hypothetical protein